MSKVLGPFEAYSLGPYPRHWARGASFRTNRPLLPRLKRINWHGAPPYALGLRWGRFGFVYWLPRSYNLRRWLG